MKLPFSKAKTRQEKDKLIGEGYFELQRLADIGVDANINEEKATKSYPQLRSLYKLFQLALPHFKKWKPKAEWDLGAIKEYAKSELGYTRPPSGFEIAMMIKQSKFEIKTEEEKNRMVNFCKKIYQNISFAEFTKEQAFNFAKEFEVWCHEKGWSDVYLTNEEREAYWASLEKFNNKKE